MIYKFKSKATGDTVMLGPNGDQLLSLLGRQPDLRPVEVCDILHDACVLSARRGPRGATLPRNPPES